MGGKLFEMELKIEWREDAKFLSIRQTKLKDLYPPTAPHRYQYLKQRRMILSRRLPRHLPTPYINYKLSHQTLISRPIKTMAPSTSFTLFDLEAYS